MCLYHLHLLVMMILNSNQKLKKRNLRYLKFVYSLYFNLYLYYAFYFIYFFGLVTFSILNVTLKASHKFKKQLTFLWFPTFLASKVNLRTEHHLSDSWR